MSIEDFFDRCKLVCLPMMKGTSPAIVQNYVKFLGSLTAKERPHLAKMCDYLLLPLVVRLKNGGANLAKIREAEQILIFQALQSFLIMVPLTKAEMFIDILHNVTLFTFQVKSNQKLSKWKHSEDLRIEATKALHQLFLNIENSTFVSIVCDINLRPLLGQIISSALDFALDDRLRELQMYSCFLIDAIISCLKKNAKGPEAIACFLPGVCSTLVQVVNGDSKQGSKVLACASFTLCNVLTEVFSDKIHGGNKRELTFAELLKFTKEEMAPATPSKKAKANELIPTVDFTTEWLESSTKRVEKVIELIFNFDLERHTIVQKQLFSSGSTLLSMCGQTLGNCMIRVLEYLLAVREAEGLESEQIDRIVEANRQSEDFEDQISERLRELWIQLPRIVRTDTEDTIVQHINLVKAYLRILASISDASVFSFWSASHERLLASAIACASVDLGDLYSLKQHHSRSFLHRFPEVRFRHLKSDRTHRSFLSLFYTLGLTSGKKLKSISHYFVEVFRDHTQRTSHMEVLAILQQLLLGAEKSSELNLILPSLTQELLTSVQFRLPVVGTGIALTRLKKHAVQISLILQITSLLRLRPELTPPVLMDHLYLILEKLGSESPLVQQSARACVERIYVSLNFDSIEMFILENVDYLIESIVQRLNFTEYRERCTKMLIALLSGTDAPKIILPLLRDTIEAILDRIYDVSHNRADKAVTDYLRVFFAVAKAIRRTRADPKPRTNQSRAREPLRFSPEEVLSYLKQYQSYLEILFDPDIVDEEEEAVDNNQQNGDENEQETTKLTEIEQTAAKLSEHSTHFLNHKSPGIRYLSLCIVEECVYILGGNQDALLPVVAQAWDSFKFLFQLHDKGTLLKALELLVAMIRFAGTFLTRRVGEDTWPDFKSAMKRNVQELQNALSQVNIEQSFPCKILVALMEAFTLLANQHDGEVILPLLVDSVDYFIQLLDIRFPMKIQEPARELIVLLAGLDEDYVWFRCMEHLPKSHRLLPKFDAHPPFPYFHPHGEQFAENVEYVLKSLDGMPEPYLRGYTYRPGLKV